MIKAMMTPISNWCNTNIPNMVRVMRDLGRNIVRLVTLGVLVNIVATSFYPEFPERFPVIYGWFDGWAQFGEFAVRAVLGGGYAFFTGNWNSFWAEYATAFHELLHQFTQWLATIHF